MLRHIRPFSCTSHAPSAQGAFPPLGAGRESWQAPSLARGPRRRCRCGGGIARSSRALSAGGLPKAPAGRALPRCPARSHAHLVLLGELQPVVGLQPVDVVGEVRHGDGGVVAHACGCDKEGREERERVTALRARGGGLDSSMCTAKPRGGHEADTRDGRCEAPGGMERRSARPRGMRHALSEHTVQ